MADAVCWAAVRGLVLRDASARDFLKRTAPAVLAWFEHTDALPTFQAITAEYDRLAAPILKVQAHHFKHGRTHERTHERTHGPKDERTHKRTHKRTHERTHERTHGPINCLPASSYWAVAALSLVQLASLVLDDNRPPETKVRAGTAIDVTIQPGKTV